MAGSENGDREEALAPIPEDLSGERPVNAPDELLVDFWVVLDGADTDTHSHFPFVREDPSSQWSGFDLDDD